MTFCLTVNAQIDIYLQRKTVITPTYCDRQACANCLDPNQTSQNASSDQDLHCLLVNQQFLNKSTGGKMEISNQIL